MPHNRRHSSTDRDSRSSYQDRYRGRRHRHRRSPTYSSSSDRDRDRRGRGYRQEGSYARSRRCVCTEACNQWLICHFVNQMHKRCLCDVDEAEVKCRPLTVFCCLAVAAMAIAPWSTGRLIEDAGRDTDAWITAGIVTGKESLTEWLKVTTNATFLQTCTTTDEAARGTANGLNRTGGKAAGVSTKEGGVEQGPIAHRPR